MRWSQRPQLSRIVLRAARSAPAAVVAHLERWAKKDYAIPSIYYTFLRDVDLRG